MQNRQIPPNIFFIKSLHNICISLKEFSFFKTLSNFLLKWEKTRSSREREGERDFDVAACSWQSRGQPVSLNKRQTRPQRDAMPENAYVSKMGSGQRMLEAVPPYRAFSALNANNAIIAVVRWQLRASSDIIHVSVGFRGGAEGAVN